MVIQSGQSQEFVYVGSQIPNDVYIENLDTERDAYYKVESGPQSWQLFGLVPPGQRIIITVDWPTRKAIISNIGPENTPIDVYGPDLYPWSQDDKE